MEIEGNQLTELLQCENKYIEEIKKRWGQETLPSKTENALRIGKRYELLGDMQAEKELLTILNRKRIKWER